MTLTSGAVRQRLGEELTARLLADRYRALSRLRGEKGGADWFAVRMLGRPALVTKGEEGVRTFYDPELVTRRAAVPAPIRLVLFGPGAVHGLNGEAHQRRKRLFLDVVTARSVMALSSGLADRLDGAVGDWLERGTINLFDELVELYGAVVLEWAGTGVSGAQARAVSRDLAAIVDGFGVAGTAYPRAVLGRVRAQRWALGVIRDARRGQLHAPQGSAVAILAGASREELPDIVAATELLNIVRPTVAVAYFGAYAAQALSEHRQWRAELAAGSPTHLRAFEHEIRRWYPFTPLLTGRLQKSYAWAGRTFRRRSWMVLDVMGTNRDPRLWEHADEFRPERFLAREPTAFDYVPHGGGDPAAGHRCPGEPIAIGVLETTLQRLAGLDYDLTPEGHEVPLGRIPSLPPDHVRLRNLRRAG